MRYPVEGNMIPTNLTNSIDPGGQSVQIGPKFGPWGPNLTQKDHTRSGWTQISSDLKRITQPNTPFSFQK